MTDSLLGEVEALTTVGLDKTKCGVNLMKYKINS